MPDYFSCNFNAGDTIGIVGGNGAGKSPTFIKMLTGQRLVDNRTITPGARPQALEFGGVYYQIGINLDEDWRVLDYVKQRVLAKDETTLTHGGTFRDHHGIIGIDAIPISRGALEVGTRGL
eukprot:464165_1